MKVRLGWITFNFYLESKTYFVIFVEAELEEIVHQRYYLLMFSRSLFGLLADSLTFLMTENRDVLSANSLGERQSSEERSFT